MTHAARVLVVGVSSLVGIAVSAQPLSEKAPAEIQEKLAAGQSMELIVLFEHESVQQEARIRRARAGLAHDDAGLLEFKKERYRAIKQKALLALRANEREVTQEYDQLPMIALRLHSADALSRLLARPDVAAVYPNKQYRLILNQSLPLVHQPVAVAAGKTGAGTTVAVLDTGVNYTQAAFGSCTAPGVPAGCKVAVALDTAPQDNAPDAHGHGTNVAGIASGVAPGARIAAIDVFDGALAYSIDIIEGINWTIANKNAYNIVALNMSLGDGVKHTSPCTTDVFRQPIIEARNAGMLSVVAAGNESFLDGLSSPACAPEAVSVGAVYDSNIGGVSWGSGCTDSATSADKVTCFSNTATYLTLLAPGALITAAGSTMGGTSMAAPHVAGAIAVLRAAFPGESADLTAQRLVNGGVSVNDARPEPDILKPRLDFATTFPAPDNADLAATLTANPAVVLLGGNIAYTATVNNLGPSTAETVTVIDALPATLSFVSADADCTHVTSVITCDLGSLAGGASLSRQIVVRADATGILDNSVQTASQTADANSANNTANAFVTVDPSANLVLALDGTPNPAQVGEEVTYSPVVTNAGPSAAENVLLTATLPGSANFAGASGECTASAGQVLCALGRMVSGASYTGFIKAQYATPGTPSLSVSVSSDTGDPVVANNVAAVSTTVNDAPPLAEDSGDIPALPTWGMLLLGGWLLRMLTRRAG